MNIPVLIEPNYRHSVWCGQILHGMQAEINKKKYRLHLIECPNYRDVDFGSVFAGAQRLLIVVGTSVSWVPEALAFFKSINIQVVLVGYQPDAKVPLRGVVRMDYTAAMYQLVQYLYGCGRTRIALYGCNLNSSADRIKRRCFRTLCPAADSTAPDTDIYYNRASLARCFEEFLPHIQHYNAVICANDIVAVSLLKRLQKLELRVPETLFITCFGDSTLPALVSPGITTISLNHTEVGRQAVELYGQLYRQPKAISSSIHVESELYIRQSTQEMPDKGGNPAVPYTEDGIESVDFYLDDEARQLCMLDALIAQCDSLDLDILSGILAEQTYEYIAEACNTTVSTLRYRLKRILGLALLNSKDELVALLRNDLPEMLL